MELNLTASDLRRINRRIVLRELFASETVSLIEMSQRSGLSAGTITNVVRELLADGIVQEDEFPHAERGSKRAILSLNRGYGYILGGRIGETDIAVELFDLHLHSLALFHAFLSSDERSPDQLVDSIVQKVTTFLQEEHIAQEKILGFGLGMEGIVEYSESELVSSPAWQWQPVPLKKMLARHFPFPIHLDNGAKAAALAQIASHPHLAATMVVLLILGTGVGAGIVSEGRLYRGSTNSAGEWGHTIIALDGRLCRCGCRGCLEAYLGVPGVLSRLQERDATHVALQMGDEVSRVQTLIRMASYDTAARQVLEETIHYLGAGIANLINLLNPQQVILGGWWGQELGQFALADIRAVTRQYALKQPYEIVEILASQTGCEGTNYGMARMVLDNFFDIAGEYSVNAFPHVLQN